MKGHLLMVFKNSVLRRLFGPRRDEVTGSWRNLHIKEFHNLYSSPSVIRMVKEDKTSSECSMSGRRRGIKVELSQ
jgi:hypothetical protein